MNTSLLLLLLLTSWFLPPSHPLHQFVETRLLITSAGQLGGSSYAVVVDGERAYFGLGTRLVIADMTNPNAPVILGRSPALNAQIRDIAIAGATLYVVASGHLWLWDVSNPAAPVSLTRTDIQKDARWVTLASGHAYVSGGEMVDIFRLDNPVLPNWIGTYSGDGSLNGAGKVAVSGQLAYVPGGFNRGLAVLDISDPARPKSVGAYSSTPGHSTNGVSISNGYAYIAGSFGLQIAQLNDPEKPQKIGEYNADFGTAVDVLVDKSTLYLPLDVTGVRILDVSDPGNPHPIGLIKREHSPPHTLARMGDHLLIASLMGGVRIVDVRTPATPVLESEVRAIGRARNIEMAGGYFYLAEGGRGLWIVERAKVNEGVEVARFVDVGNAALDLTLAGKYLFVAGGFAGVAILDVSDPANPVVAATHDTPGSAWQVAVMGNYAYVADFNGGLRIIDITNVKQPSEVGSIPLTNLQSGTTRVSATPDRLFVYTDSQLDIYSIQLAPSVPVKVGSYSSGMHLSNVISEGDLLYLTEGFTSHRLLILDISNPAQPVEIGTHPLTSTALQPSVWAIAKQDDRVAVAFGIDGLIILDVSQPSAPRQIGTFPTAWDATGLYLLGDEIAVGNDDGGLLILQLTTGHELFLPGLYKDVR